MIEVGSINNSTNFLWEIVSGFLRNVDTSVAGVYIKSDSGFVVLEGGEGAFYLATDKIVINLNNPANEVKIRLEAGRFDVADLLGDNVFSITNTGQIWLKNTRSETITTPNGQVVEIFDSTGASIGFLPLYDIL